MLGSNTFAEVVLEGGPPNLAESQSSTQEGDAGALHDSSPSEHEKEKGKCEKEMRRYDSSHELIFMLTGCISSSHNSRPSPS